MQTLDSVWISEEHKAILQLSITTCTNICTWNYTINCICANTMTIILLIPTLVPSLIPGRLPQHERQVEAVGCTAVFESGISHVS